MTNKESLEIITKEYLSKVNCCDECCAEHYCIKECIKTSREPVDGCDKKIIAYLKGRI